MVRGGRSPARGGEEGCQTLVEAVVGDGHMVLEVEDLVGSHLVVDRGLEEDMVPVAQDMVVVADIALVVVHIRVVVNLYWMVSDKSRPILCDLILTNMGRWSSIVIALRWSSVRHRVKFQNGI